MPRIITMKTSGQRDYRLEERHGEVEIAVKLRRGKGVGQRQRSFHVCEQ
jgi:hypothetical protein